ncbi:MAG TPA: response regulator [Anaerolineales bacterium]|nr:response regulator [Anaerolineales bacterium]HRQ91716.1 response regulator [Anaerolineales bacterium]
MNSTKLAWLVDDDQEMAAAIALMLKVLGYQTRSFLDAPSAAQALLAEQPCDLILLDLNMPQVSGQDFLEFMRQRRQFMHIPVVILSSEFNEVIMQQLLDLGADGYITKPVSTAELEAAVAAALSARNTD